MNFYDWETIITPTWTTHLWQYWTDANIYPGISKFWSYKITRRNDQFIMDMLKSSISDEKTLFQLNCCRIHLQVLTADIVELSGKRILDDCLLGKNMRHSNLNWPKQILPVGWWNLWSSYLSSIIAPYICQHKLGPVVNDSHQSWVWKLMLVKNSYRAASLNFVS